MRRLLLAALLVSLWVSTANQPGTNAREPLPPPAFTLVASAPPLESGSSVLLLPLSPAGEAFRISDPAHGVRFDIDGDGVREMVAWPEAGADVALLAVDTNRDGTIASGKELVGGATFDEPSNGCNALLRMFERSGAEPAGSIHAGHDLYDRLLLWNDRNHDGRSEPGELIPAREHFTAIGLGYHPVRWADAHGNRVGYEGWVHARTGDARQGEPASAEEDRQRTRRYFEVVLLTAAR